MHLLKVQKPLEKTKLFKQHFLKHPSNIKFWLIFNSFHHKDDNREYSMHLSEIKD